MPLLSVIVPVYNEEKTIRLIIEKIQAVNIDKEIIIIDDCSTDGTRSILSDLENNQKNQGSFKIIYHKTNLGKGASVREGIKATNGEIIVLQDADLEYDPNDYHRLIKPLIENQADLVLGARFTNSHTGLFLHRLGNKFLSRLVNFLYGSNLNDYATCYKLARKTTFNKLKLRRSRFELDVEIVCKALNKRLRIAEIPVAYHPRTYQEGKKIRWMDGIHAMVAMLLCKLSD